MGTNTSRTLKEQPFGQRDEAEGFYRALAATGQQVRVGMEAKRTRTLVRTIAGGVAVRVVDGRCVRD